MKGHTALAIPLGAGDFGAVQTARAHDLDALGAKAHGVLHGPLHGAAEHDPLLELLGDVLCDELGIDLWLANLFDVDVHRHAHHGGELRLEGLDVFALLANHNAGTGAENGDLGVLGRALNEDATHSSALEAFFKEVANLDVFIEHLAEVAGVGEPT